MADLTNFTVQASLEVVDFSTAALIIFTAAFSRIIVSSLIAASFLIIASFPIVVFFGLMRSSSASDFPSGSDSHILIHAIHTILITHTIFIPTNLSVLAEFSRKLLS